VESHKPNRFSIETRVQNEALLAGDTHALHVKRMVILLHGYGESAQVMLDRFPDLQCLNGTVVASIEALHPIYLPTGKTGSSWMTSYRREASIQNNLTYMKSALSALKAERTWDQLILVGYSQGAQMAMRTAHWIDADTLIAVGGEVPPELKSEPKSSSKCYNVVLMRGKKDMALSAHTMNNDLLWYQDNGHRVSTQEWPGGHMWSEESTKNVTHEILTTKTPS
jgi:predicted esterase